MSQSEWFPEGIGNDRGLVGRYFCHHPHFVRRSSSNANSAFSASEGLRGLRSHSLDDTLLRRGLNACNFQVDSDLRGSILSVGLSPDTEPDERNRISLAYDRLDPFGLPSPRLHVDYTTRDLKTFDFARTVGSQISVALGSQGEPEYFRYIHSHPSGTCRMAESVDSGVVDANCRVFGTDNLYLSGACTFPVAGATNPTNTVVALTLRLADHILERHREEG